VKVFSWCEIDCELITVQLPKLDAKSKGKAIYKAYNQYLMETQGLSKSEVDEWAYHSTDEVDGVVFIRAYTGRHWAFNIMDRKQTRTIGEMLIVLIAGGVQNIHEFTDCMGEEWEGLDLAKISDPTFNPDKFNAAVIEEFRRKED
jgi:hypothetical protein